MRWNAMECDGMRWNAMESDGKRWNVMEYDGMRWNVMECDGMRWNELRSHFVFKLLASTVLPTSHSCGVIMNITMGKVPWMVLVDL